MYIIINLLIISKDQMLNYKRIQMKIQKQKVKFNYNKCSKKFNSKIAYFQIDPTVQVREII